MRYPKAECPSCEQMFKPFYAEQIYCDECREESAEGLGWHYNDNDEPTEED